MMHNTWILVANDAGARLFDGRGRGEGLELVETIEHPDGRARNRDVDSDRPGRAFRKNSADPRRAAMGSSESPHDQIIAEFARTLCNKLRLARTQNQYGRLVLVAPPRLLGLLRSSLDGPTAQLVIGSLNKDLASSDEAELIEHLREMIAV
ncbi:MAG: host attachment protein [Polyangiales bacterium]